MPAKQAFPESPRKKQALEKAIGAISARHHMRSYLAHLGDDYVLPDSRASGPDIVRLLHFSHHALYIILSIISLQYSPYLSMQEYSS